jgi:hypothetical protein
VAAARSVTVAAHGSSISPISVNGIHQAERRQVNFDYLAYGTIFTRAMFLLKIKLDVFFFTRKA